MTNAVQIADAEASLEELVERAEQGECILLIRDGRAVARLGPLPHKESSKQPAVFGDLAGLWFAEDLSIPDDIIDDFYASEPFPE